MNTEKGLPEFVAIKGTPRFSANQLRQLQAVTGMTMEQVMNDQASVMQAFAWFQLRKDGYEVSWADAGDIPIQFDDVPADPT